MIETNADKIVLHITKTFNEVCGVDLSEYEKSIIHTAINFTRQSTPNQYSLVLNDMEKLTLLESEYNYFIYKLEDIYRVKYVEYHSKFDSIFSTKTRAGSPNQLATTCYVHSLNNNELLILESELNKCLNLINYLKADLSTIKSKYRTLDAKRLNTF